MKIVENNQAFPPHTYFTEVESKFQNFTPGCRVLPARFYHEPNLHFTLKRRYEPGESKYFPNGGFEIQDVNGGIYNFDLNEVVVHPFHFGMHRYFSQAKNVVKEKVAGTGGKRGRPKKDPSTLKVKQVYVPTGKGRGRPRKDPSTLKVKQEYIPTGKGRGRPKKQQA